LKFESHLATSVKGTIVWVKAESLLLFNIAYLIIFVNGYFNNNYINEAEMGKEGLKSSFFKKKIMVLDHFFIQHLLEHPAMKVLVLFDIIIIIWKIMKLNTLTKKMGLMKRRPFGQHCRIYFFYYLFFLNIEKASLLSITLNRALFGFFL